MHEKAAAAEAFHSRRHGRVVIPVKGVLDLDAAARLAELVASREGVENQRVHIDLRHARELHDVAVVALARALRARDVVLMGLSQHHERLLGYVGAGAEVSPAP